MSRIGTNVSSLIAQRTLANQNQSLNQSLERLSTGFRINKGSDDPSGLIASESLRSEKTSIQAAIGNAERADQVVSIAEGGLQEVNSALLDIQGLVGQSANDAGLSDQEKAANQLEVDSILQTIDRVAGSTSFQGTKLLNGTFDFDISNQSDKVEDVNINGAKLQHNQSQAVDVSVTASAQHGGLVLSIATGTSLDLGTGSGGSPDERLSFEIAGKAGSREFTFASGTTISGVAAQVNTFTEVTGVSATTSGSGIVFKSTGYGSDEFVSVNVTDDGGQSGKISQLTADNEDAAQTGSGADTTALSAANNAIRDAGQDVGAIINGIAATTDGKNAKINTDFLNVDLTLSDDGATSKSSIDAFTIDGGGARFNLGPNVDINNQSSIGIGSVASRNLGSTALGFLDELGSGKSANLEGGDLGKAQKVVNAAIDQVSSLRGRIGAFQKNTVGSTINSLNVALENTSAAESSIRDTDFAKETAQLSRSQILVQAATNTLGIANQQPQNALALLR